MWTWKIQAFSERRADTSNRKERSRKSSGRVVLLSRRAARDFFGIIFVRLISKLSGIRYELALTLKNMIQSNWIVVELQARENEEKTLNLHKRSLGQKYHSKGGDFVDAFCNVR